jgi:putative Mg2+ transporter-C (MgtC) family protein
MQIDLLFSETALRIGLAMLAGILLGLNRWIHHKSAGVRTHTIVSIGAAVSILMISHVTGSDAQTQSRVFQGIIQGIGFVGAGIILHQGTSNTVKGLTTSASIWAVAILGACFGAGQNVIGLSGLGAIVLILIIGRPLELAVGRIFGITQKSEIDHDSGE